MRDADGAPCWDDDELAERDVRVALEEAHPAHGTPLLLGGASQGAAQAVRMATTGRVPGCSGFIAVVGAAPEDKIGTAPVRGWLIAGERDVLVRRRQEALHAELLRRGMPCRLEVVPGLAHWYPRDLATRLARALDFVIAPPPQ